MGRFTSFHPAAAKVSIYQAFLDAVMKKREPGWMTSPVGRHLRDPLADLHRICKSGFCLKIVTDILSLGPYMNEKEIQRKMRGRTEHIQEETT